MSMEGQSVWLVILLGLFGAGGFVSLLIRIFDWIAARPINRQDVKNKSITGEISIAENWRQYAQQVREDNERFKAEMLEKFEAEKREHTAELEELKAELTRRHIAEMEALKHEKNIEIEGLKKRVKDLEDELAKYRDNPTLKTLL